MSMSQVVQEIARQLRGQRVNLKGKKLVKVDDNTLRVHTPGRLGHTGGRSVDIEYDKANDLYNVSIHTIDKNFQIKSCKAHGIFFDSLPDYFKPNATKLMKCSR